MSSEQQEEQRFERRESDRRMRELERSVKCLHAAFENFAESYKPSLDKIVQENQYWAKVRQELVTHAAKGIVWATIVGFAYLIMLAAQDYAHQLIESAIARKK
jgi:hypothetical protein